MLKLSGWISSIPLLFLCSKPNDGRFAKYKTLEAYEVRAGILMMPNYTDDGKICEIGLERLHYSSNVISTDTVMSRDTIDKLVDELVPAEERGKKSTQFGVGDLVDTVGNSTITHVDYENVSIAIFGSPSSDLGQAEIDDGGLVATVHWKNRKCR